MARNIVDRGWLRKMVERGRVTVVDSYYCDDMMGIEKIAHPMPAVIAPPHGQDRDPGVCYIMRSEFQTSSGRAHRLANGDVHLKVHGNCTYTLRIAP